MAIFVKCSASHVLRSFRELPTVHAHTKVLLPAKVTYLAQFVRWEVQCVIQFVPRIHDARMRSMSLLKSAVFQLILVSSRSL